jgi:uncharacterized OB-fold protein
MDADETYSDVVISRAAVVTSLLVTTATTPELKRGVVIVAVVRIGETDVVTATAIHS